MSQAIGVEAAPADAAGHMGADTRPGDVMTTTSTDDGLAPATDQDPAQRGPIRPDPNPAPVTFFTTFLLAVIALSVFIIVGGEVGWLR